MSLNVIDVFRVDTQEAEYESCFLKMAAFSQPLLEWRRAEKTRELLISGYVYFLDSANVTDVSLCTCDVRVVCLQGSMTCVANACVFIGNVDQRDMVSCWTDGLVLCRTEVTQWFTASVADQDPKTKVGWVGVCVS